MGISLVHIDRSRDRHWSEVETWNCRVNVGAARCCRCCLNASVLFRVTVCLLYLSFQCFGLLLTVGNIHTGKGPKVSFASPNRPKTVSIPRSSAWPRVRGSHIEGAIEAYRFGPHACLERGGGRQRLRFAELQRLSSAICDQHRRIPLHAAAEPGATCFGDRGWRWE